MTLTYVLRAMFIRVLVSGRHTTLEGVYAEIEAHTDIPARHIQCLLWGRDEHGRRLPSRSR